MAVFLENCGVGKSCRLNWKVKFSQQLGLQCDNKTVFVNGEFLCIISTSDVTTNKFSFTAFNASKNSLYKTGYVMHFSYIISLTANDSIHTPLRNLIRLFLFRVLLCLLCDFCTQGESSCAGLSSTCCRWQPSSVCSLVPRNSLTLTFPPGVSKAQSKGSRAGSSSGDDS